MNKMTAYSLVAVSCAFGTLAQAQPTEFPLRGVVPNIAYAVSDIENTNLATGNIGLKIPIASLSPGRGGLNFDFSLMYSSSIWDYSTVMYQNATQDAPACTIPQHHVQESSQGGWHFTDGYEILAISKTNQFQDFCAVKCNGMGESDVIYDRQYKIRFPDGSLHDLVPVGSPGWVKAGYTNLTLGGYLTCVGNGYPVGAGSQPIEVSNGSGAITDFYTNDGTYARVRVTGGLVSGSWTVNFADGRQVKVENSVQKIYDANGTDANGNYISISTDTDDQGRNRETIADPLGRNIVITYNSPVAGQDTITAPGGGGTNLTWIVKWGDWGNPPATNRSYDMYDNDPPGVSPTTEVVPPLVVVTEIDPPLGLNPYYFDYNASSAYSVGALHRITLPSGATATYTYSLDSEPTTVLYSAFRGNVITNKVINHDADSDPSPLNYQYAVGLPLAGAIGVASLTAPDGSVTTQYVTYQGLPYRTVYPDGTVVEKTWLQTVPEDSLPGPGSPDQESCPVSSQAAVPCPNPSESAEYTTIPGGNTSAKMYTVNLAGGVTEIDETGWGTLSHDQNGLPASYSGTILRRTKRDYYGTTTSNGPNTMCTQGFYCDPAANRVAYLLKSETVESADISPIPASRTEYCYEDPASRPNIVATAAWDSTQGAMPSSLISGCIPLSLSANAVATQATYDTYGNVRSKMDAMGYPTQYTDDSIDGGSGPANLWPTTVTNPLGQMTQYRYDLNTGAVISTTDPNSVTTSTAPDVFGRPLTIQKAGTTTTMIYDDAHRIVATQSDLDDNRQVASIQRFDQLNRISLDQQLEHGTDLTQSGSTITTPATTGILTTYRYTYSGANRYAAVSAPYRFGQTDPKVGWTQTTYDGMDQPIQVGTFDDGLPSTVWGPSSNATSTGVVRTDYLFNPTGWTGRATQITDPAGKVRINYFDGLGRLATVTEDPGGLNYATSYNYDLLDDLTDVVQGGQHRMFGYTSLRRLSYAAMPEKQGTTYYQYDKNGNLLTKSEPRDVSPPSWSITTPRSITTSMGYDALSRLTNKSYSGTIDDEGTSSVTYCYDAPLSSGSCTGSSQQGYIGRLSAVTNSVSSTTYTYDALGRYQTSQQTTAGASYSFSYSYNRASLLTSITYPSNRTVNFTADDANRVQAVSGGGANYAANVTYTPHGAIAGMMLGNNVVTESTAFNGRLQPISIQAGNLKMEYTYGEGGDATKNNGNLASQKIYWQSALQATQVYTYDRVNRLVLANENSALPSDTTCPATANAVWCENYYYGDGLGNRLIGYRSGQSTTSAVEAGAYDSGTNRISSAGWGYDASGNIKADPLSESFVYDAENRQTAATAAGVAQYKYDGDGRRVLQSDTTGNQTVFVYDAFGNLAAEYGSATTAASTTEYLTADHLGSTRMVTDSLHSELHDYFPFGGEVSRSGNWRFGLAPDVDSAGIRLKFTGKERDAETGLDYFESRYFSAAQGRFTSPDRAGMFAVSLANPQTLNRYSYVVNNPLSLTDPHGYDCVYLNSDRNGVGSVDNQIDSKGCGKGGGYWVDGTVTQAQITKDRWGSTVSLTGTTNGTDITSANYRDTALLVEWVVNTSFNPLGHIALGLSGTVPVGQNPANDGQFVRSMLGNFAKSVLANGNAYSAPTDALANTTVPGAILPQIGGTLKDFTWIPVTGMQATMLQNAINQSRQYPPAYSVFGGTACGALDCGTWAQQMMSAAGVNSGPAAPIPQQLLKQLVDIYGGR